MDTLLTGTDSDLIDHIQSRKKLAEKLETDPNFKKKYIEEQQSKTQFNNTEIDEIEKLIEQANAARNDNIQSDILEDNDIFQEREDIPDDDDENYANLIPRYIHIENVKKIVIHIHK